MPCDLIDHPAWAALLAARKQLASGAPRLQLAGRTGAWSFAAEVPPDAEQVLSVVDDELAPPGAVPTEVRHSVFRWRPGSLPTVDHPTGRPCEPELLALARVYLPVLLGAHAARRQGRVFVAAHVTQSLDGRIACLNGQSQWLGNEADRRHAHRMRALCDAVVVGAGTALADDPQLTVRHVHGPHPRRVVLSGTGSVLRTARALQLFTGPGCDVLVGAPHAGPSTASSVRLVPVPAVEGCMAPTAVLEQLAARGIHSIYLEGGANTLSSFLAARCVDVLQVHVAPRVLGSGLPSVRLAPIDHVDEGLGFVMDHAALDGDLLLTCWPRTPVRHR